MYWANFLHIYQPPTQTKTILEKVVNESYRKIIAGLLDHPNARLTLNISGVLTEMLVKEGYHDVIKNIRILLERGQIELTGTAKYHPFLPKLPTSEIVRQIKLNDETNSKYFGPAYNPQGFFPPEMCYSPHVEEVVSQLGFKWMILDEIAIDTPVDYSKTYKSPTGLYIFLRERHLSFKILSAKLGTADMLIRELKDRLSKNEYLLTAMDGETFGHHRPGLEQMLIEIYEETRLPTITISEIADKFPETVTISPRLSNWAMMKNELDINLPYGRWDNPENPIHQKQWQLVNLVIDTFNQYSHEDRDMLDKSLHSDQFWWASARPWWSLEMIERGAFDLLQAVESIPNVPTKIKSQAKKLYFDIITTGFAWQRDGTVENLAKQEDEEIKHMMYGEKSEVTREDYDQLINSLIPQMHAAAQGESYDRAAQFKRRIEELRSARDNIPYPEEELKVNQ